MRSVILSLFACTATTALAESPLVVTDIPPVHGLVAQVMNGVGAPELLLEKGASPHHYSLRPSDARSLSNADLVIWMGPNLSEWMDEPVDTLATNAVTLNLLETQGWDKRPFSEHEEHDDHEGEHGDHHDDHADHQEDHGDHHDDHADHKDEHDAHHDDHTDHEGEHDDHHDHGDFDPHAWLDPSVAQVWVSEIATLLSDQDPANAALYAANAEAAIADIVQLEADVAAIVTKPNGEYLLPHDAYGYFIDRWDLPGYDVIADGHGQKPGAARIAELQAEIAEGHIACLFGDLETNPDWLALIADGSDLKPGTLDIMGWEQDLGVTHYRATLTAMANSFAECG